jgi:hypothetical protein
MREATTGAPQGTAYIAHLWEYPNLTLAFFGVQFQSEEAAALYEESGIEDQMRASMAEEPGMLCMREFPEGNGGVQLQYWRSHEELAAYSKRLPHMAWWKWLLEHDGQGFSLYHEFYVCRAAEAIFEQGTEPVGPGTFCTLSATELGGNRSSERLQRFADAQEEALGDGVSGRT